MKSSLNSLSTSLNVIDTRRKFSGCRGNLDHGPLLFNEHREDKNGEKILVPVRFSLGLRKNEATVERQGQERLAPILVRSIGPQWRIGPLPSLQ